MVAALPRQPKRFPAFALLRGASVAGLVWAGACGGGGDEQSKQIERLRARYQVKLSGWVVAQMPPPANPESVAEAAPSTETDASGGLLDAPAAVSDIDLDFEIRHVGAEKLKGLTVEVTQADGMGKAKAHYRVWLDTETIEPGATAKRTYTLMEVPHAVGDVFTAALRQRVPASEFSLYKEFPASR